ncbi:tripartite tricarboxylate transporter TctB family protein [Caproiciproducens faecalis]|uniref:Tripartite tricarboxylate transporter TctB family protein n=1 Tax=Caproiciproducens faecalis TaxID=2820301 RepID=A0ABS7DLI3_9FIRM|nr:tripartite tricarboxylate transporter TctB family protein [Caproiciproducens faecalis]MBW7571411.1 tripartite tricarboxylate transporter TctB family protein [Caproiciproducens faecalis]
MSSTRKNIFSGIFFLLFAAFIYIESNFINLSKADPIGPQFFPRVIAIVMAILAVVQIVKNWVVLKKEKVQQTDEKAETKKSSSKMAFWLTVAMLIVYPLVIQYVGFIILTSVYLFCQIFLLLPEGSIRSKKNVIKAAIISVVFTVCVYFLFTKMFLIFLPSGLLG